MSVPDPRGLPENLDGGVFAGAAHIIETSKGACPVAEDYSEAAAYQPSPNPVPYRMTHGSARAANAGSRILSVIPDGGLSPRQVAGLGIPLYARIWALVCVCGLGRRELSEFARRCAAKTLAPESSLAVRHCLETGDPALFAEAMSDVEKAKDSLPWRWREDLAAQSLALKFSSAEPQEDSRRSMSSVDVVAIVKLVTKHFEKTKQAPVEQRLLDDLLQIMGEG